jgi:hypothetical protein
VARLVVLLMDVVLTWHEWSTGVKVGVDRFVCARDARRPESHGADGNWRADVLGALGELAVAKATGTYWAGNLGAPDRGAPDVGPFHVRTADAPGKRLILHDYDDDAGLFVLVVAIGVCRFHIVGWCRGHEGKKADYWQTFTGRPCFFVPNELLRPLDRLAA